MAGPGCDCGLGLLLLRLLLRGVGSPPAGLPLQQGAREGRLGGVQDLGGGVAVLPGTGAGVWRLGRLGVQVGVRVGVQRRAGVLNEAVAAAVCVCVGGGVSVCGGSVCMRSVCVLCA